MFQLGNLFNYLLSIPLGTKRHYGIITTVTAFIAMVILVRIMVIAVARGGHAFALPSLNFALPSKLRSYLNCT